MIDPKDLVGWHRYHTEKDWTQKKRNLTRTANSVHAAIRSNDLELSPEEQLALKAAHAVLERGCAIYAKAAGIAKKDAAERAKRLQLSKELVKRKFAVLQSTADRVALIASATSHAFDPTSPCVEGLTEARDKRHYALRIRDEQFEDALETVAYRLSDQSVPLAEQLEQIWAKFQELKPSLIQRHAWVILQIDQALAAPATTAGN